MYGVFDSYNQLLRVFPYYKQAITYKIACQRWDWKVEII
jgi:hypothetical protein